MDEKRIEVVTMKAKDIKTGFGNPRKITKKNREELAESLELHGDFGLFLIDENDNIIAGNQRLSVIVEKNPEQEILCKRLIGYSTAELRAINIKDNTHSGDWELDLLADWTADLNIDLGLELDNSNPNDHDVENMPLIHYEKYDYVLIACRYETDYNDLIRKLGIEGKKVVIHKGKNDRKIKARAILYDQIQSQLNGKEEK